MIRVAVVASTNGSVLNAVLKLGFMKERIAFVLSDRECGALAVAEANGVTPVRLFSEDAQVFSDMLAEFFTVNTMDLVVSFYTKVFKGRVIPMLEGKFVNFHPSILPACPGRDGFGDTVRSRSKFIGATVHAIDHGVDTGVPLMQVAIPFDPGMSLRVNRHRIFVSQCKMFIQLVDWFDQGRFQVNSAGDLHLVGGKYSKKLFSPNLENLLAISFRP